MSLAVESCARKNTFYVVGDFMFTTEFAIRWRGTNGALRNAFLKSEAFSRMFLLLSGARPKCAL